jgi:hypothetical protein
VIADEAAVESPLWAEALRSDPEHDPVFSPLADERYALGLETIYEGYLLHYGRPRLFAPVEPHSALLLGDYLFAHGLVRIAAWQRVEAVRDLAALISLCARLRADGVPGDGESWAATAAFLGRGPLLETRDATAHAASAREAAGDEAVDRALAAHAERVG